MALELVEPLWDRVIVRRAENTQDMTAGGIVVPEVSKEKPIEGTGEAVGCGRILDSGKIIPLRVKVGDKVLFGKYSGAEVKLGPIGSEKDLLILREDEVLAIVRG